jgi:hypothetical protein
MRMQKRIAVTLSGLVFAGGAALAVGSATAGAPTSNGNTTVAPHNTAYGELSVMNLGSRSICRRLPGHWKYISTPTSRRYHYRKRVYVPGRIICHPTRHDHRR